MDYPPVAIIIPTYNRAKIVHWTIALLRSNLRYSGQFRFYVGCDGTDNTPDALSDSDCIILTPGSGSLGANLNRLLARAQADGIDYYFSLDDDHALMNRINLDPHVERLINDTSSGWIQMLLDAVNDEHFEPSKFTAHVEGKYWRVHYDDQDDWPFSFRAHLSTRAMHEALGKFLEGVVPGICEWEFNQRAKTLGVSGKLPSVLLPVCAYGYSFWGHVGQGPSRK